jgi:hypothetical protein
LWTQVRVEICHDRRMRDPTAVPSPDEWILLLATHALVAELFARIDRGDVDEAAGLYAEDASFLGARGPVEIQQTMRRGLEANLGHRSRHVIGNVRSGIAEDGSVLVEYTVVAYTLDGTGPPVPRTVIDQEQVVRRRPDGRLEIAEHRLLGFAPPT